MAALMDQVRNLVRLTIAAGKHNGSRYRVSTNRFSSDCSNADPSKKKRGRKKTIKKKKSTPVSDNTTDRPPRTSYPFHGRHIDSTVLRTDKSEATSEFLYRDDDSNGRRYYIFQDGDYWQYKLPSVTNILQSTMPRSSWYSLHNWKQNMIKELGQEGFDKWRDEILNDGRKFHSLIESRLNRTTKKTTKYNVDYNRHQPLTSSWSTKQDKLSTHTVIDREYPVTEDNVELLHSISNGFSYLSSSISFSPLPSTSYFNSCYKNYRFFESIKNVLSDISDVMVTEGVVRHTQLGYSGTVDCVARYKDKLCVIDWKTSPKLKPSLSDLYDYPLQTVAYAGAINSNISFPYKVENVLIVVAYSTGESAHAHLLDSACCLHYWEKWIDRLEQYQLQFSHDLSTVYV